MIEGADVFLGLSAGNVLEADMVGRDGRAAADPGAGQPHAGSAAGSGQERARLTPSSATGRSDYPNQVNNVLCFPYIFRGALDVGATTITRGMEKAAV